MVTLAGHIVLVFVVETVLLVVANSAADQTRSLFSTKQRRGNTAATQQNTQAHPSSDKYVIVVGYSSMTVLVLL